MLEAIDQFGTEMLFGSGSAFLDHLALTLTNALTWVPLYIALVVLIIKNNDNMQQIALCFCCAVLCAVLCSVADNVIVKPWVARVRPCNDPAVKYLAQIAGNLHSKDYSFFSAHAANTMSLAVYFALLVRNRLLSISLVAWSLVNCWTRLYLGQHFLTDVLAGIAFGIMVGAMCYALYMRLGLRAPFDQRFVSSQYTSTGYLRIDVDVVVSVLFLTFVVALVLC